MLAQKGKLLVIMVAILGTMLLSGCSDDQKNPKEVKEDKPPEQSQDVNQEAPRGEHKSQQGEVNESQESIRKAVEISSRFLRGKVRNEMSMMLPLVTPKFRAEIERAAVNQKESKKKDDKRLQDLRLDAQKKSLNGRIKVFATYIVQAEETGQPERIAQFIELEKEGDRWLVVAVRDVEKPKK